jgi:hypothetical protein
MTGPGGAGPDALEAEVARLAERLRSLSDVRLAASFAHPEGSRAGAAHGLAQVLADLAADLEGQARRRVPRLDDLAVGDQVQVTGSDLARAARSARLQRGSPAAGRAVEEATAACRALRLAL